MPDRLPPRTLVAVPDGGETPNIMALCDALAHTRAVAAALLADMEAAAPRVDPTSVNYGAPFDGDWAEWVTHRRLKVRATRDGCVYLVDEWTDMLAMDPAEARTLALTLLAAGKWSESVP